MTSDSGAEVRQIVFDCLANEPAGMIRLIQRFRGPVFGLCYRMLGQWQDAEDAAQETFLRVSKSLRRWDATREFEPWLLAIAANCCRSQIKRRQRRVECVSLELRDSALAETSVAGLAEEVERALTGMTPDWATAFRLFHEQSLSYQQIATQLNRPEGTIKTWVHRARRELAQVLTRRGVVPLSRSGTS